MSFELLFPVPFLPLFCAPPRHEFFKSRISIQFTLFIFVPETERERDSTVTPKLEQKNSEI